VILMGCEARKDFF